MQVYIALEALPWESFSVEASDDEGRAAQVQARSTASMAGFLPIYWSEAAAKAALPHAKVQEIDVPDDWHPFVRSGSFAPAEPSAEEASV
jgi:hypothetical protein